MSLITLIILAIALGTDAFSLCVGIGLAGVNRRQIILISVTVLIFHIAMPLIGWLVGEFAGSLLGRVAAIAGSLLLVYLGIKMIWTTWRHRLEQAPARINFSVGGLLLLGASVSMDALSVGFTLGAHQVNLLLTAGLIGVVAGLMTFAGLFFGRFLVGWVGEKAQLLGGLVLVGIGIKMIF
ncbi:MAG: manganese efflux pump MntP family protein [Desulfotomaculaceae bacterium]|nr:manganese efflux pump MntP family protein [Desulfotomaculaceae bacterium]